MNNFLDKMNYKVVSIVLSIIVVGLLMSMVLVSVVSYNTGYDKGQRNTYQKVQEDLEDILYGD